MNATVQNWDFAFLQKRLQDSVGCSERAADLIREYRKFAHIVAKYPDEEVAMAGEVDEAWHLHILDTIDYVDFCHRAYGRYLHHRPSTDDDGAHEQLVENYSKLLARMADEFGAVNEAVWPTVDQVKVHCSGCDKCRGIFANANIIAP